MTGHVVATCDLPQPTAHPMGGPAGGHQRADPNRQDRSSTMKGRSAHGGGSPEAPKNESPIAQEEDAGEVEDKEGFESASGEPGGARTG